ncbi:hypothetical protein [Adhaeribacter aquaticus]|uniref:hypothetical protein n=1 Tax=Adhaeribacter aquaticus TaxID=299567 RepID=UPI0005515375|nr:hypothetical protein [Adhaeribacter aquaticus]
MSAQSITTLTLFGIKKGHWCWGLAQMGTMPPLLKQVKGLQFFKLLGSPKGGVFNIKPDFYLYGMFGVWESEAVADNFFKNSSIFYEYQQHCNETWTIKLNPIKAHGLWDGVNPFQVTKATPHLTKPIAVLTRASINVRAIPAFWKHGAATSKAIEQAEGLIAAVGLGELPFVRQATFSIWKTENDIIQYAYKSAQHQQVIKKTRTDNWYSEELFARFEVLGATGSWKGKNPLESYQEEASPV